MLAAFEGRGRDTAPPPLAHVAPCTGRCAIGATTGWGVAPPTAGVVPAAALRTTGDALRVGSMVAARRFPSVAPPPGRLPVALSEADAVREPPFAAGSRAVAGAAAGAVKGAVGGAEDGAKVEATADVAGAEVSGVVVEEGTPVGEGAGLCTPGAASSQPRSSPSSTPGSM